MTALRPEVAVGDARSARVALIVWTLVFLFLVLLPLAVAIETARHFTGVAIDGPFQLYNALRRIEAGYRPGIDFQFFHGIGMAYLHYPLYKLLGGGLAGSELGRELLSVLVYPLVWLVIFRVFTRDWVQTLYLSSIAMAMSVILDLTGIMAAQSGMLGLRSLIPTILPVVIWLSPSRRVRTVTVGIAIGLSIFLSTEQGLATILSYVVVSAAALWRRKDKRGQLLESIGSLALGGVVFLGALVAVGGIAGARGILRYNFKLVPMDQYWYFGAPPNAVAPTWGLFVAMLLTTWRILVPIFLAIGGLAMYARRFWREPDGDTGRRSLAFGFLMVYALVSCTSLLGIFVTIYAQPCWRAVMIVWLLELPAAAVRFDTRKGWSPWLRVPRVELGLIVAALAGMVVVVPQLFGIMTVTWPEIVKHHVIHHDPFEPADIWPRTLQIGQEMLDSRRTPDGKLPTLWSTYAGWLEARNGIFNPSFDYIIHALGPANRAAYMAKFRQVRPRLVQTVVPTYTIYEPWIETTSWDLYAELQRWYTVAGSTGWSIFWERRDTPAPADSLMANISVPPGARVIPLPAAPAVVGEKYTLLEVELSYAVHNPLRRLPLLGTLPRYVVIPDGAENRDAILLDPYTPTMRFPVVAEAGKPLRLLLGTLSLLPGASYEVTSARVSLVPVDPRNRGWLRNLVAEMHAPVAR